MNDPTLSFPDDRGTVTVDVPSDAATDETAEVSPPGFELLDEVGRGGMGVVFRARDLALNREVAIKFLRPGVRPGSATAVRFVEEARIAGQLQHPGIPAVYQVGTLPDGRPFLAMKLIKGRTLDDLLSEDLDPVAHRGRFVAAFEQLCQAVAYAHACGVIHRDLKPQNVMVGAFGEVQVMDWGLAKRIRNADDGMRNDHPPPELAPAVDSSALAAPDSASGVRLAPDSVLGTGYSNLTQHGSVLGNPAYMPPEQAVGDHARMGPPADVFGLGAILCALLTGKPPFEGKGVESVRLAAAAGDTVAAFARLDGCGADPAVVALSKRCLAFDPAERPADAGAVANEIARIRAAADDRAKRAEVERAADAVRAGEQSKRRRLLQWAATAVIVVLIAGVTVSFWQAQLARREAADAETARQAEAGARARASARLTKAVEAVERMVTRAGTARWARDPSLAAERRQVLEDAVAFYEGFGEADDPVVRRETARAHRRIGAAYLLLAEHAKSADYLQRSLAGCQALVADVPDNSGYAAELAQTRLYIAASAASTGRTTEAQATYRDAADAARRAVALGATDDETRRTVVSCLIGSSFFTLQSDPVAAAALIREAEREISGLMADPVAPFATRALAAYTYASVATHDFAGGRPADGVANVRGGASGPAAPPPRPAAPAHYQDVFDLTDGLLTMTNGSLLAAAEPVRAAELYRLAAEKFDRLLAVYPKAFQYRFYQVLILQQEIQALGRLRRTAEAKRRRAECLAAVAVMRETAPLPPVLTRVAAVQKSQALADAAQDGQMADFDRRADEVLAEAAADPELSGVRYNVACALALGSRYGTPEQREGRAARSVEVLSGLLATRFYAGRTNAHHVAADTDLVPLRRRDDFKEFMTALRLKFPPPPEVLPPPRAIKEK